MDLLLMANSFVEKAHGKETRKFTGEPYILHLQETAQLLWEVTDGTASIDEYIAALCHDVVENTTITLMEIGRHFGGKTMGLVDELTSNKEQQNLLGKAIYLTNKINNMSTEALTIKFCDRLSNIAGLRDSRVPLYFVDKYIKETQYILEHIKCSISEQQQNLINRIVHMLIFLRVKRNL